MAEEAKTTTKRSKPKFLRTDWHKKIRLGKGVKKNQKWHGAKGRQNKLRLNRKGRMQRPKIGWGADTKVKDFVSGMEAIRVKMLKTWKLLVKVLELLLQKLGPKRSLKLLQKQMR
ncbi:MAG: hypothetical protein OEL87_00710 [Nanoarchaeota archaeon]|nr:hypothetical protein [Nanoarchaeota archaeon]